MINKYPPDAGINNLVAITDRLSEHYFKDIGFICSTGLNYIAQVLEMDVHGSMALNAVLCEQIITEVMDIVELKKKNFLPYLYQLGEKQQHAHDCSTCSGKCNMEHSMQLHYMHASNKKVESILHRLEAEGTPMHNIDYPNLYGTLRKQMAILENRLRELYQYEEATVIPAVINAQQKIKAHS